MFGGLKTVVRQVALAAVLISTLGGPAAANAPATDARPPLLPVEVFADRDLFHSPRMSPDGSKIAVRMVDSASGGVVVMDSTDKRIVGGVRLTKDLEYNWHRWAGPDIVLVSVSKMSSYAGEELRLSRLMAVRISTKAQWYVGPKAMGPEGDDLLYVADDGSNVLLSFQKNIDEWPSVTRISLLNERDVGTMVQRPVENIWEWYADDAGVVRMGTGWINRKLRVSYRKSEAEKFREIARIGEDDEDKFWDVTRIIGGSDEALLLHEDDKGRVELARYNLATREKIATVHRNENWDITEAWFDKDGKPIAVDYTDDRDRRVWLEPGMAKLQKGFEAALKEDEVWIGSRADDKSRMLVFAGGETDPGAYYVFDSARRKLDLFAAMRPRLDITQMARPKPVAITARDGLQMTAYLTLPRGRTPKGLPMIIMPHGGPYGVRDKLEYDDWVQFLANRGYAVLQPNYRGSGGYGKAFEEKGDGQIGRAMQDDIDDAMDWAVKEGIADKGRVCVIGASYGGYAAMWSVIRNPERYRCAASFAGVTDWKKMLKYDARFFTRKGAKKWNQRVAGKEFDLDLVAPLHTIGKLTRPLLVAHGKLDTNVPFTQYKMLVSAAEKAGVGFEQMVFEEEGHGFDEPANQARWLSGIEKFLKKNNPPD